MPKFKNKKRPMINMKKSVVFLCFFMTLVLILPLIHAASPQEHIVINSGKWSDVYSGIMYSNLKGVPNNFLTSTADGKFLLKGIEKTKSVKILTSSDEPYVFNYPSEFESAGFASADETKFSDMNLGLIDQLQNITNFVVVGDSFGYNALAVAPYAVQKKAWVFLANPNNIYQIDSILSQRNVNSLLIYGYVDPVVRNVLSKYNPEIIDNGDRFTDNIEIVKRYLKIHSTGQTVLTNGEFIEKEIMAGSEPVLFTGQTNVPSQISNWLKNSPITVGVLIGNNLVNAATNIRQTTGISVLVKFARNARDQTGGIAPVEGLDLFPVPTPTMSLKLHTVEYSSAQSRLYVTYKSDSNIPIYIKGTITLNNGRNTQRVGDSDPIFIAPNVYKTISYPINISDSQNMTAEVYTLYGETSTGLEKVLKNTTSVNKVQVIDSCSLTKEDVKSVEYNKQEKAISIYIKNPENVDCWVSVEIQGMKIGYSTKTIGTDGSIMIPSGDTGKLKINQELSDSDLQSNPYVNLVVSSGEKQDSLVNILRGSFPLQIQNFTLTSYLIMGVIIIIISLLIFFFIIKKKQKEEEYY